MLILKLSKSTSLFLVFCFVLFTACKKDIGKETFLQEDFSIAKDAIPAYYFDWETVDRMPTSAAYNIVVPWANGSLKGFPSDIWYDYKSSDGWELVYNRFNPNEVLPANPFFVLYNKYRGLLRIYIYVTTSGFTNSDYLTDGLNLSPNSINSSMLNFIGQDVIDVNNKQSKVTKIEGTQIATGVWYAAQYELAYDPAIQGSTFQQIGLNWTLKWTNISTVSLGGTAVGSLKGTIVTPSSSGFNLGQTIVKGALQAAGLGIFDNNKGPDANHPGIGNTLGLKAFVFEAAKNGLSGGFSGTIKDFFNGILGGNSNNTQQVNLTLNADIKLSGSIAGSGAVIPDPGLGFGVSGTSNSQSAPGLIPRYDQPMGVFNISNRPVVTVTTVEHSDGTIEGTRYTHTFNLVDNSYQKIYNPIVTNIAQIQNVYEEVILINPPQIDWVNSAVGLFETIGEETAYSRVRYVTLPYDQSLINSRVAVRLAFDVVPNNGTPKSRIVKTFLADVIWQ